MRFKIATGFDTRQHDEIFTTAEFSDEALREIVMGVLHKLEYAQRESLLRRLGKEGKLTIVEGSV